MASHCAASSKNVANLNEKGPAAMRALFRWVGWNTLCVWAVRNSTVTLNLFQGDAIRDNFAFKSSQTQRPGSLAWGHSIHHRRLALRLAFALVQLQPLALPFHGRAWPRLFRVRALVPLVPPLLRVQPWLLAPLACGRALRVHALRHHPMALRPRQDARSWCQSAFRCFQWLLRQPW